MALKDAAGDLERWPSLGRMLAEIAGRRPRRGALFAGRRRIDYGDLNADANRYGRALAERMGVGAGDRVAILLENGVDYIRAVWGALKAGAVVVPLNTFFAPRELEYILADSGVSALFSSDEFAPLVRSISGRLPSLERLVTFGREDLGRDTRLHEELLDGIPASDPEGDPRRDRDAVIIYTSGTTGKPKGAVLTHGNLLSNIASSARCIRIRKRDRVLLTLPMFHSFTLTVCILMPAAVGAGIVIVEKLRSITHVIRTAVARRATIFVGIPHLYETMARRGISPWMKALMRIRFCISGSAPLAETTLEMFEKRFGVPLLEGYGLSETSPVVSINPIDGVRKPGSVGLPIPGVSVRIVSKEGNELPAGEVGEIAVSGPNVMKCYLNRPKETGETIRDGWLLTGDIGTIDEDGYIYVLDRKKDMILFHGMNVYPREIEEVIYSHPSVAEAAVVGRPDRRRGEVPVAYISFKEGKEADKSDIIDLCKESLASYKIPRKIIVLRSLPRNPTGKILKRELKERLLASH